MTVAATYGFGQKLSDIKNPNDLSNAILFELVGTTFSIISMVIAKWSLGLFLLRLVQEIWHKVVIWICMGSLLATSVAVCFIGWFQCVPVKYLWERLIPGGYCHIDPTPASMLLCSMIPSALGYILKAMANETCRLG